MVTLSNAVIENNFNKKGFANHNIAIGLGLFSLALTLITWSLTDIPSIRDDTWEYIKISENILKYGSYSLSSRGQFPTAKRLPGYPFFLLPFVKRWPESALIVSILQSLMFASCVALTYLISTRIGINRKASIIASLLLMADLTFIGYCKAVASDAPAAFLFYLSCFLIIRSSSTYSMLIPGVLFAFAAMHRPNYLALVPIMLFFLLIKYRYKNCSMKKMVISFGIRSVWLLLPFMIIGSSWIIRNYKRFGYLTYTTWKGPGLISQLSHFLSASDPNYNLDYIKLSQAVLDKYLEENPALKSPETLIYNNDNPIVETRKFLDYQVMFFKEKSRLIKRTIMFSIPRNYLNSIFQRGNRELIPRKLFGREIGWIWTISHSLIICCGLVIMLLYRSHNAYIKLLIIFFLSSIFIIATSYFSPEYPLRFSFPILMFIYVCSASGFEAKFTQLVNCGKKFIKWKHYF